MLCPVCSNVELVMAERQGIEIDYCPTCRGVWLDRGELDKIIERSLRLEGGGPQAGAGTLLQRPPNEHSRGYDDHHRDDHGRSREGHRRSIWTELFD